MIVVHGTRAFRDRVAGVSAAPGEVSTTALGAWYATLLRWRRPVALLVNETTLLPLLTPLAPARTLLRRIPAAVTDLLAAHRAPTAFIAAEQAAMTEVRLAPTVNRSVVGVLTEFTFLADTYRAHLHHSSIAHTSADQPDVDRADVDRAGPPRADSPQAGEHDLLALAQRLATTPLGPLYTRHTSPDRELAALLTRHTPTASRRPAAPPRWDSSGS